MDTSNDTKTIISRWNNFRIRLILQGIIIGLVTGLIVVFYRIAIEKAGDFTAYIYKLMYKNPVIIPFWFIILILCGILVGYMVEKEPLISGSGIPQVEGYLLRKVDMKWLKVLIMKFIGGFLSLAAGISVGREGPSIQMGAAIGQGFSRIAKRTKVEEKYLVTAGASAGLTAAFNAPIAGVLFALEEVHKNFSPIVLTTALSASITADFVSKQFFGLAPVFNFEKLTPIPLKFYPYIIILGILIGFMGVIFSKGLLGTQDIYSKRIKIMPRYWPVIPFVLAGVLGFIYPQVLGGGHKLIESVYNTPYTIKFLILLLFIKFIFTLISYGSSAPGGIFLPLLVIGAILGAIYGLTLNKFFGFPSIYVNNIIIIAMAAYFCAIVKAPMTGMILLTEMTGSFSHLLSIAVASIIAYVVTYLLKSEPIYESLLDKFLNKGKSKFKASDGNKILVEVPVVLGSSLGGKLIKEINWPSKCLIVSIKRGDKELIPSGNSEIYPGDYLIVLVNETDAVGVYDSLSKNAAKCEIFK
jgi:H+/Cl- antiporter ClcA